MRSMTLPMSESLILYRAKAWQKDELRNCSGREVICTFSADQLAYNFVPPRQLLQRSYKELSTPLSLIIHTIHSFRIIPSALALQAPQLLNSHMGHSYRLSKTSLLTIVIIWSIALYLPVSAGPADRVEVPDELRAQNVLEPHNLLHRAYADHRYADSGMPKHSGSSSTPAVCFRETILHRPGRWDLVVC